MTSASRDDDRQPCLEVLEGRSAGRVFPLEQRSYVVGRMPGVEIHIDDSGVSRRHFRITRKADDRIEVADMRSTNGLIVNGAKVDRMVLDEGDRISLGPDAVLRLAYRAPEDMRDAVPPAADRDSPAQASVQAREAGVPEAHSDEATGVIVRRIPSIDEIPLSPRQLEVSQLVAEGLTNAQVAERLGISPRTVTSHLDHIYGRLDIGSRAALTRWIVERGLAETET